MLLIVSKATYVRLGMLKGALILLSASMLCCRFLLRRNDIPTQGGICPCINAQSINNML